MNIFARILQGLQLFPVVINSVQGLLGPGNGAKKAALTTQLVAEAIGVTALVAGKNIADPDGWDRGMKMVNDGVVELLKASDWQHQAPGATLALAGIQRPVLTGPGAITEKGKK